jgi:hypothetical protein
MRTALIALLIAATLAATTPAWGVAPPLSTPGTLSLVDEGAVEILYRGQVEPLDAASFAQTLAAVSIAASIPPNPINPWLVDLALHTAGIPHRDYASCWPNDGALLIVPTAPAGAVDAALAAAGAYYDPNRHAREFAAAFWQRLFTYRDPGTARIPGWPGDPTMESLKETIVGGLPFPANLAPMATYQARGIVPFLQLRGEYQLVCFFFICFWFPRCVVRFVPTSEGYGIIGLR